MSEQILTAPSLPKLRKGSKGEAVYVVQLLLVNFHGYSIATDAHFGPETENAIKDLQASRELSPTGVVDNVTWETLATEA
ncbi:peptidoglycan-binding protein [Aetokthonos hydrillicola Thurmond2011]|jgi:peptidoglycan hydrolase-like protein with peptidoglycan-binding domain|uniref:Peptidoglycan-binding protein n=1 Tax=Aetokthonos hydrillicola Thurmond2011 TaxID=2712845 RepID=A0AAP5I3V2_9CYAN|nr:peptidoglycan-binding domain-containing protein [Aetokthonos hydrillicola]MBO3458606.1 peptidoglycan-binding protein [Aetokthonos hydrillicola CCALA 1050]MBW4585049.1 peptidoglycan-binding protein [Aetokthonos hydrillicola CCALA 1050]MDR9894190.1 peptidoglycan-binding protein [Aetokthonos hydrillicola Thurmond2011]